MGVAYIDVGTDYSDPHDDPMKPPLKMVAYDEDGEIVETRGKIVVTPRLGDGGMASGRAFKPSALGHPDLIKIAKEMGLGRGGWGPFIFEMRTPHMSWRNSPAITIHPAAEWFPLLPKDELEALAKDIKENYLREKVTTIINGGRQLVIDGRNRLDAMELAGLNVVSRQTNRLLAVVCSDLTKGSDIDLADPAKVEAFIVSKNIQRRHLTADQKRELIAALLKSNPARSDRVIAAIAKSSPQTATAVRRDLEATAQIEQLDKRTGKDGKARPAKGKSTAKAAEAEEVATCPLLAQPEHLRAEAWGHGETLTTMKGHWRFLTAEEQDEFLEWASEHQKSRWRRGPDLEHKAPQEACGDRAEEGQAAPRGFEAGWVQYGQQTAAFLVIVQMSPPQGAIVLCPTWGNVRLPAR